MKIKFTQLNPEYNHPAKRREAHTHVKKMSEHELNVSDPHFYNRIMSRFANGLISLAELRDGKHS